MFKTLVNALKVKDIRSRIFFTLGILLIFRIGCTITIPGVDVAAVQATLQSVLGSDGNAWLSMFTGGSLEQMSIFALNVTPYITSSIIMQLLTIAIPALEEMQHDGEDGRKKMTAITRYVTVLLAIIEAAGLAISLQNANALGSDANWFTVVTMIVTLTAGSTLVMWLGERITEKGIGNGISIILLINIVSRMPNDFSNLYTMFVGKQFKEAEYVKGIGAALVIIAVIILTTILVILLQDAKRSIPIQYSQKVSGRRTIGGRATEMPLKVNTAGVIPIIFASSLLSMPTMIVSLFKINVTNAVVQEIISSLSQNYWFSKGHPWGYVGLAIYIALVIMFAYFYTSITFNPMEVANNLKKSGASVPGIRPGKPTQEYLEKVLKYIIFIGAVALVIVAIIPIFFSGVFGANVSFGGTSLIIIVGVILETLNQLDSKMLDRNYEGFLK
ncbi:MAG: preprotein translocase subunit SecY [Lachnospiraceae bacterium]|nr:preprotein translocase subunit SecY [Lachnospiraceae bacterium]MBP3504937.1 preprotein translocase subunit SecY [Lachnospiraceae bacterium]